MVPQYSNKLCWIRSTKLPLPPRYRSAFHFLSFTYRVFTFFGYIFPNVLINFSQWNFPDPPVWLRPSTFTPCTVRFQHKLKSYFRPLPLYICIFYLHTLYNSPTSYRLNQNKFLRILLKEALDTLSLATTCKYSRLIFFSQIT